MVSPSFGFIYHTVYHNLYLKLLFSDKKPDILKLTKMLTHTKNIQIGNKQSLKAHKEGSSQHRVAKVLDISQPAIYGVIKRNKQ